MDDLDGALEAFVASLRAHAAVVRSDGDDAAAVQAFAEAAFAYADAVTDRGYLPPWEEDFEFGDSPGDAPAPGRIAVRVRADFVVTDLAAALAAGTAARRRVWADPAAEPCTGIGEVVYELVHDAGPVLPMLDVPGLLRDGALLVVHPATGALTSVADLAVGDEEEALFQLVEQ